MIKITTASSSSLVNQSMEDAIREAVKSWDAQIMSISGNECKISIKVLCTC